LAKGGCRRGEEAVHPFEGRNNARRGGGTVFGKEENRKEGSSSLKPEE